MVSATQDYWRSRKFVPNRLGGGILFSLILEGLSNPGTKNLQILSLRKAGVMGGQSIIMMLLSTLEETMISNLT